MNLKDPLITILIKKTPFNNNSKNDNILKNQNINLKSQVTPTPTHQKNNLLNHKGGSEQLEPEKLEPEQSEPIPITGEPIMKVFVKILEIIDSRKG
jgi:hypothetical protein